MIRRPLMVAGVVLLALGAIVSAFAAILHDETL